MKIIAHGQSDTLICEMSKDELAKALGYYSGYGVESKERDAFAAGKEFDLKERTEYVKDLEGFPGHVTNLRKELDHMVKRLKNMEAIAASPVFQVVEQAKKTKQQ